VGVEVATERILRAVLLVGVTSGTFGVCVGVGVPLCSSCAGVVCGSERGGVADREEEKEGALSLLCCCTENVESGGTSIGVTCSTSPAIISCSSSSSSSTLMLAIARSSHSSLERGDRNESAYAELYDKEGVREGEKENKAVCWCAVVLSFSLPTSIDINDASEGDILCACVGARGSSCSWASASRTISAGHARAVGIVII
jgi:hypothetical protein